jgi:hypothetical protein
MDDILKNRLKELGLLPLELDSEAQILYRAHGIDPSKVEMHFSPGTPPQVVEAYECINKKVLRLHRMELICQAGTSYYTLVEDSIKNDLRHLTFKCTTHEKPSLTGIIGFTRDI